MIPKVVVVHEGPICSCPFCQRDFFKCFLSFFSLECIGKVLACFSVPFIQIVLRIFSLAGCPSVDLGQRRPLLCLFAFPRKVLQHLCRILGRHHALPCHISGHKLIDIVCLFLTHGKVVKTCCSCHACTGHTTNNSGISNILHKVGESGEFCLSFRHSLPQVSVVSLHGLGIALHDHKVRSGIKYLGCHFF